MQVPRQACADRAPIALTMLALTTVAVMTMPARAEDRLVLPEIVITGKPAPDVNQQRCADPTTGNDPSLGCLNERMKRTVDRVNPSLNLPPIDARSSDLKVGVANVPGVQQQYGRNFGHSVIPFRPPPPVYNTFGGRH
jgi:hypothetical protein